MHKACLYFVLTLAGADPENIFRGGGGGGGGGTLDNNQWAF